MFIKDNKYKKQLREKKISRYLYETIAAGAGCALPISSSCCAKCIFCSNNMNPFLIYREKFRELSDIKKGIKLLSENVREVRLGDSLPGRISEGEAMLHPQFFKVLDLIRKKIPEAVLQINTNATMLTKEFIEKLVPYKPMKFTISYHSDNPKYWCKIFNLKKNHYKIARNSFYHLVKNGFFVEATIVPLPAYVGYEDLEKTLIFQRSFTKTIIVYFPGYSRIFPSNSRKILYFDKKKLHDFFIEMRKKYRIKLSVLGDFMYPVFINPQNTMSKVDTDGFDQALWFFSEAVYKYGKEAVEKMSTHVNSKNFVYMVKNKTYGGNIKCAGLLMVEDYCQTIKKALKRKENNNKKNKVIIISGTSFDHFGDDLKGENHERITKEFGYPVWLR